MAINDLEQFGRGGGSVQELAQSLLQALMQAAGVPGGISGPLSGMGANMLLGNSPYASAQIFNSGTNTGVFMGQQYALRDQMNRMVANDVANSVRRQTLIGAYNIANPGANQEQAAAFADNMTGKWGYGMVHGMLDSAFGLDYSADIGNYMGIFASRQAMNGLRRNDPRWLSTAKQVASNFFGEGPYDREEFGGLSQRSAAILAAHIGNDTDFTSGAYGTDPAAIANKLREKVNDYGQALEPLKDVFGEDIPRIIQTIEELAGTNIGHMDRVRVKDMANTLSNNILAGNYTLDEFVRTDASIRAQMQQIPGMPTNWYTMHGAMADAALKMVKGDTPYFMEQQQFKAIAGELAASPAISNTGEDFVKAFTIWQNNEYNSRPKGEQNGFLATVDDFRAELSKMTGGVSMDNALKLAGVGNKFGLSQAYGMDNYYANLKSGAGLELARDEYADYRRQRVAFANARNTDLLSALGTGSKGLEALTGLMFDLMDEDVGADLLNMSQAERSDYLVQAFGARLGKSADEQKLTADRLSRLMTYNANDERTSKDMAAAQAIGNERRARRRTEDVEAMREALDALNTSFLNPSDGWAKVLSDPNLYTKEGLQKLLSETNSLFEASDSNLYTATVQGAMMLAQDSMEPLGADATEDEKKKWLERRQKKARDMANYSVSAAGLTNTVFQTAVEHAGDADAKTWARIAEAAMVPGAENAIAAYLGDAESTDYAKRVDELSSALAKEFEKDPGKQDVGDIVRSLDYEKRVKQVADLETDPKKQARIQELDKSIAEAASRMDSDESNRTTSSEYAAAVRKALDAEIGKGSKADQEKIAMLQEREGMLRDSSKDTNALNISNFGRSVLTMLADIRNGVAPDAVKEASKDDGGASKQRPSEYRRRSRR